MSITQTKFRIYFPKSYRTFLRVFVQFSNNKIIFVIKLPILTSEIYYYYHLIPVPVQNITIIPITPYLGMSTNDYITSSECQKIEDVYICSSPSQPKDNTCLVQLISKADHSNCQVHHVTISKPIITQLEENHILVIPVNILQIPNCQNGIQTIDKPTIIHLPQGCNIIIANQRFTATQSQIPI